MKVEDRDLVAIYVIRRTLNRLPWTTSVRVLVFVLREVWPDAHAYLMREDCYRSRA